jgi:hypothetical protein
MHFVFWDEEQDSRQVQLMLLLAQLAPGDLRHKEARMEQSMHAMV